MAGRDGKIFLSLAFEADVIVWRGPAPFVFAPVPDQHTDEIRDAARQASYGWGVVPVEATIGAFTFRTSLFPRDGAYLLPIKLAVRRATGLEPGDRISAEMRVTAPINRAQIPLRRSHGAHAPD